MQTPILIHANPKDVRDSSTVMLEAGIYVVMSNHTDSVINLGTEAEPYLGVKNGFKFNVPKRTPCKASIVRPGSETAISMNLRKVE